MKLKAITRLLRNNNALEKLELVGCSDADREMNGFLKNLEGTTVDKVLIRTDFLVELQEENVTKLLNAVSAISGLKELVIQSSSKFHMGVIPAVGILPLRRASNLERLAFEDMQVTASHKAFIAALAKLVENHATLKSISLPNFFANDWANTSPGVLDALMLSLSTVPNLECLEVSGCGSHAFGQDVELVSPTALPKLFGNPRLHTLQLSFLELEERHFEVISQQLCKNESIHTMALDYHRLDNNGFREVMHAMQTNTKIQNLSLRSLNDIGTEGFSDAMAMLQMNYTIENLSVTTSSRAQQGKIELYLRMNTAGRGLLREPTASMSQWVDILANHSDDLDVVRHLLREIPGLCHAATVGSQRKDAVVSVDMPSTYAAAS